MNWDGHIIVAGILNSIVTFIAVWRGYLLPDIQILLLIIVTTLIYAILPDIDMKNSNIRMFVSVIGLLLIIVSTIINFYYFEHWIFIAVSLFSASGLLLLFFAKHGGHFHSLIAGFIISALVYPIEPVLVFFAFFAYQSHLIVDHHKKKIW